MAFTVSVTVLVLLPLMVILVDPTPSAVKVIVQLAPIGRLAPQVVELCKMLLSSGIIALTLLAASEDDALLVTVTVPLPLTRKFKGDGVTVITAVAAGPRVILKVSTAAG